LRSLSVQKFRGLGEFTMCGLGRVNLLVGSNNCGKTTVLEAVQLLLGAGDPSVLWNTLVRRGEELQAVGDSMAPRAMDVRHLFEGHELGVGRAFRVAGRNDGEPFALDVEIVKASIRYVLDPEGSEPTSPLPDALSIMLRWGSGRELAIRLTEAGGLELGPWSRKRADNDDIRPVELIPAGALTERDTVSRLEDVVLTENEDLLIRALRSIDDRIERIAPLGSRVRSRGGGRGGVAVKLAGAKNRIPLGSMGDGMWRMLGIALALVRARGGVLLVDEIDTGLHYSVMESMWRLVHDAAQRLDVQVFAATHSRDCYQSLAAIVQAEKASRPEVTIQRIERGRPRAVAFTDDEIRVAAEIGAEVR
jgi:ABC-type nitrate/sulfonate/bicarbonate transport system ATPase subunit